MLTDTPYSQIGDTVYTNEEITKCIKKLAAVYEADIPVEDPITVVGITDGSIFFLPQFLKELQSLRGPGSAKVFVFTIQAKKIEGVVSVSGGPVSLHGCVLVLDDLCDTGKTLLSVKSHLQDIDPESDILTMCLVNRPAKYTPNYVGFSYEVPGFLIGYGMDYNEMFRDLPDIRELVLIHDPEEDMTPISVEDSEEEEIDPTQSMCCVT